MWIVLCGGEHALLPRNALAPVHRLYFAPPMAPTPSGGCMGHRRLGVGSAGRRARPGAQWATTLPAAVSMDPTKTAAALSYGRVRAGSGNLIRAGKLVGSWGGQSTLHQVRSTTKSIGSILIGVAIKDKRITFDTKPNVRPQFCHAADLQPRPRAGWTGHRSPARHPDRRVPQDRGFRAPCCSSRAPAGSTATAERTGSPICSP